MQWASMPNMPISSSEFSSVSMYWLLMDAQPPVATFISQ